MADEVYPNLDDILIEMNNLPCSHPASVNTDVADFFYSLTKMLRPLLIVEIGCFIGFSTIHFAKAFKEIGFGSIISIDAFDWEVDVGKRMQNRKEIAEYYRKKARMEDIITYIKGYSTEVYPQIAKQINNKIDLLYIDGDHSVKGVFGDFNTYYNDLRLGGYLILHDINPLMCGCDGPRVLIEHLKVSRAVPKHLEIIEMQTRDGFGISVLRKKNKKPIHLSPPMHSVLRKGLKKLIKWGPGFLRTKGSFLDPIKVKIHVINKHSRNPIPDVLFVCPQREKEYRITGTDGVLYIEHYLPNRYLLDISVKGYITKRNVLVDIVAGKLSQEFTIELEPEL